MDADKRELMSSLTDTQMENQLVCRLLDRSNCIDEQRRFDAIVIWAKHFPSLERYMFRFNMPAYFDGLAERAKVYKPEVVYDLIGLDLEVHSFRVNSFRKEIQTFSYDSQQFLYAPAGFNCFESDTLVISCRIEDDDYSKLAYLSRVVVSALSDKKVLSSIELNELTVKDYVKKNG